MSQMQSTKHNMTSEGYLKLLLWKKVTWI